MRLAVFFYCIVSVFALGCKPVISGTISLDVSKYENKVYLIQPQSFDEIAASYQGHVLDSASLDEKGNFAFNTKVSSQEVLLMLFVQPKGERYKNKITSENWNTANFVPFVFKAGASVTITGKADSLFSKSMVHSTIDHNDEMQKMRNVFGKAESQYLTGLGEHNEENLMVIEKAKRKYAEDIMDFIKQTPSSFAALTAIKLLAPNGDFEAMPEFVYEQCTIWKAKEPGQVMIQQWCQKAQKSKLAIMKGETMPDYTLPMSDKTNKNLHSLLGKKLTIVDLWASWCAPCRKENKNVLVPLWQSYHEQGLEIIAYALDASEASWKNAIDKDGAYRWPHASHLQGDESPFFELLRITTIPSNFILDEKGTIVAKNLHGEDLIDFVQKYFQNQK